MDHLHDQLGGDEAMYKEIILEHYREPHNAGTIEGADIRHKELNQSCGDAIEIFVALDGDRVKDVRFEGQGCAISQASVSILTDEIKGRTLAEISALGMADMFRMLGVAVGPTRIKCALLGLKTLQAGIAARRKE
jgi:nitrogen fixation NifU-like protein